MTALEQYQGDDPRGAVLTEDVHRTYCAQCGEWDRCEPDHEHDDLCRDCWEDAYPGVPWGEDPRPDTDEDARDRDRDNQRTEEGIRNAV